MGFKHSECKQNLFVFRSVYLTAVIYETLRLRSPTPVIMAHEAIGDTTLGVSKGINNLTF